MKSIRQVISVWMVIALVGLGLTTQAQRRTYRLTDRQVDQLIRRIETRADAFRSSLDLALDRNRRIDGTRTEDNINAYVRDFETATDTLRSRFNTRTSVAADVESVLRQAANIDAFMSRTRLNARAQSDWSLLKTDLNTLASAYNVSWNWNAQGYPPVGTPQTGPGRVGDRRLDNLIRRLEDNADRFRASLTAALDNSRLDGTRREDRINDFVREFETATD
ncbi:MAG TPA: hypothetical protein VNA19_17675, partial [Pyrinomonadaceae bacterium]|nr:hypothetical protein [Pyrinomonadaceae bacterium]